MSHARDRRSCYIPAAFRGFDQQLGAGADGEGKGEAEETFLSRAPQHPTFHYAVDFHRIDDKELVQAVTCVNPENVRDANVATYFSSFNFVIHRDQPFQ